MNKKRTGSLFYDRRYDRYNIRFDLETFYGGLHCGECFEVLTKKDTWEPVRIELTDEWYLVGLPGVMPDGLRVRI